MTFYDFLNIGTLISGILASLMGYLLLKRRFVVYKLRDRVSILEDFCKTVYTTDKIDKKIIVIGPRASGKSSIVSLWYDAKKLIEEISPTNAFETYEYKIKGKKKESFYDKNISVTRVKYAQQVLKIFDYAGEDKQVPVAINQISSSPDCTILLVFNGDLGYSNDNKKYFSRTFLEKINKNFDNSGFEASNVKKVFVVFNKIDLYSNNEKNLDSYLEDIKSNFRDNITYIESIFGYNVNYMVTSATTNHNIVNLLQQIINSYE